MNIKGLLRHFRKNASSVQVIFKGEFSFNSNSQSDCDDIDGTLSIEIDFKRIDFNIKVSNGEIIYFNAFARDIYNEEKIVIREKYYQELKELLKEIYSGLSEDMIYYYVSEAL